MDRQDRYAEMDQQAGSKEPLPFLDKYNPVEYDVS